MIDQFIANTHRFIERKGLDAHVPTLLLPQRGDIRLLEGVPADVDMEEAALDWANRATLANEDFLLSFKADAKHFKVIARIHGQRREILCPIRPPNDLEPTTASQPQEESSPTSELL